MSVGPHAWLGGKLSRPNRGNNASKFLPDARKPCQLSPDFWEQFLDVRTDELRCPPGRHHLFQEFQDAEFVGPDQVLCSLFHVKSHLAVQAISGQYG
jgi:hypothetical protein